MKPILIAFCLLVSSFSGLLNQETIRVSGTYDRYEDGIYYFAGDQGEIYEFQDISEEASEQYDLMDEALIGKLFTITFTAEVTEDDDLEFKTIISLKMIQ